MENPEEEDLNHGGLKTSQTQREMDIQIHETHRTPTKLNMNRAAARHIIVRSQRQRILKVAREKINNSYIRELP